MKKQKMKWIIPCAAALFTIGASMTSLAAPGWAQENNSWVYYDNYGDLTTQSWRKSGNSWFYLDSDGELATSRIIEYDDSYYYVNSAGAMVTNEWRSIPSDYEDEDSPYTYWYYFGGNGKAYKSPNSGRTSFRSIPISTGTSYDYAFDSEGRMLYGWVDGESTRITGEDAWKDGVYYCGNSDDGAQSKGWKHLKVEDDENDTYNFDGAYWFYFKSNGKKMEDAKKTINGKKYRFNEYGAAESEWYEIPSGTTSTASTASSPNQYYNLPSQCWLAKGWFKTVPSEEIDEEGYDDGTEYWFYSDNSGDLVTSQIKSINGIKYGFNEYGEMLHGLYKLNFDSDRRIISYEEIESEDDLPEADEDCMVFYFGNSPKEGAMETGRTTLKIDGEKYTYNFRRAGSYKGAGYNKINDDRIYIHGRMLEADRYERYRVVNYNGNDYLIKTSGKIVKNRKNVKDGDDKYYITDKNGIIIDSSYEKF
ncbi:cell wall-binding protein [Clostridium sp. E02]|uniref:cell wall-binding protein n=1 Tax=Clostridium sp. E02 TaxID=2487134 RepID=UPI000F5242EE|nr:cell wall-binding protein [Clostridium sp. E02]